MKGLATPSSPSTKRQSTAPITVSIVEDDGQYAESLALVINSAEGFRCAGVHGTAKAALKRIQQEKPDVALFDLLLPDLSGPECIRELKRRLPKLNVLALTIENHDKEIFRALEAGAGGYLEKPVPYAEILEAIREIHEGGAPMSGHIARMVLRTFHQRGRSAGELENLTSREEEVLVCLAQGYTDKEIGQKLGIKVQTVNGHLKNIYQKLHVRSRTLAVTKYLGG